MMRGLMGKTPNCVNWEGMSLTKKKKIYIRDATRGKWTQAEQCRRQIVRYSTKCFLRYFSMPNVRNRLTPITTCSSASQTANCLFFGSYKLRSLMIAHTFLTTSWRGRDSAPINVAKSGDSLNGRVNALPFFGAFSFSGGFWSTPESESDSFFIRLALCFFFGSSASLSESLAAFFRFTAAFFLGGAAAARRGGFSSSDSSDSLLDSVLAASCLTATYFSTISVISLRLEARSQPSFFSICWRTAFVEVVSRSASFRMTEIMKMFF